jgi:hypothetical protein
LTTLRSQARKGHAEAQFALGNYYTALDLGPAKDIRHLRMALKWFLSAAKQGHAMAQHQLGLIYAWGPDALRNSDDAILWLRKATEQGITNALIPLGQVLNLYKDDVSGMIHCFEQAIARGNAAGYHALGMCYEYGDRVERNKIKAFNLYRKAALLDFTPAQVSLGTLLNYWAETEPKPGRPMEGIRWLRRAAELGDAYGQYTLGKLYERWQGIPPDLKRAAKLYRKAAERGELYAQMAIGRMYLDGRGVPQDFPSALKWFRIIANLRLGSIFDSVIREAYYFLGNMFLHGQGVALDYSAAFLYFSKAARGGSHSDALTNLGIMYFDGKGVPKDYIKAKRYLLRSRSNVAKGWLARMEGIRLRPPRKALPTTLEFDDSERNQLQLKLD